MNTKKEVKRKIQRLTTNILFLIILVIVYLMGHFFLQEPIDGMGKLIFAASVVGIPTLWLRIIRLKNGKTTILEYLKIYIKK